MDSIASGDGAALGTLLNRHWAQLVRHTVRMLGDTDAAEDVVQEAFARVWLHRERWRPGSSPNAYLYRIVRNLAMHEQEKRRVRDRYAQSQPEVKAHWRDPFARDGVLPALERAVAGLPPRRRDVFELGALQGLRYKEIAEVMDISVQTVANQMSAALRDLREALAHLKP